MELEASLLVSKANSSAYDLKLISSVLLKDFAPAIITSLSSLISYIHLHQQTNTNQ